MKQGISSYLMVSAVCFALSVGLIILYLQDGFALIDQLGFEVALAVRTPLLTEWMKWVTQLGGGTVLGPLGLLLVAGCYLKRYRIEAAVIAVTLLGSDLISESLKLIFARPRPSGLNLVELPDSYSFPSGHALVGLAFYGIIAAIVRERMSQFPIAAWIGPVSAALVAMICVSRVYLGVHYLSDVITGIFLSAGWYCLMLGLYRAWIGRWRKHQAEPHAPTL